MAAISSLQIGGVTYDIYAKSAEQAPGSSHELSSHSHFSTYFNGTSANSALTSKSALSAGTAKSASQVFGILATATTSAITADNSTIGSVVNPKLVFSNSGQNQKGFIIWSDYNASNAWAGDASAYFGGVAISDGFALTSDQGNSITLAKNLSATNFKATKISATNLSATNITGTLEGAARRLAKRSISFSRTVAQGGDGKKWCRIASISRPNFTTANEWGSSEAELNIYTKSYGENNTVDRGKIVLYCRWGHASASSPTYSMKTNGSRGARWLYWKPQQTSTSVSADSAVSAYTAFNGLKNVDIKIVATDTSVEWWLYNDVWDTILEITENYSNNITLYGKDSAKTLGDFKTYLSDKSQWDDVYGDGSYINYAVSAKAAPVASHDHNYTISAKTTAFNVSVGIQLSAGTNINITSAGAKAIGISARNDIANASDKSTYFDGTSALYAKSATSATNAAKAADSDKLGGTAAANVIGSAQSGYKALTALSALSGIKNYSTIVFNSGTTLRGTFTPANSASTFTLVAGANMEFTSSGANTITISSRNSTYDTTNFITATHLSNIQTASGYAADWNTNKAGLTNSAKSGWSAWSAVTANSASWATNTDTKVSQTVTSDNVFYPILTKDSNGTTTVTAGARFADVVTVNPSTKMVRANKFGITSSATMEYNTTTNSIDFIFN